MRHQKTRSALSLAFAFLLLAATLLPILCLSAAAGNISDQPMESCYYFSDYKPSNTLYNTNIAGRFSTGALYYYEEGEFLSRVREDFYSGLYDDIANAYIIFELRELLSTQPDNGETEGELVPTLYWLTQLFTRLKENNCKIMFISGTNENRYTLYRSDLLSQVEVYVDVDIWNLFVLSTFQQVFEDSGNSMQVRDTTFILDAGLSDGLKPDGPDGTEKSQEEVNLKATGWFGFHYLVPYIRSGYRDEITDTYTHIDVLEEKNCKILCHTGDNRFYDLVSGAYVTYDENAPAAFADYLANGHIYAIGSTRKGGASLWQWLNILNTVNTVTSLSIPAYVYNSSGTNLPIYENMDLKQAGGTVDLSDAILQFIGGEDMSEFNNHPSPLVPVYYFPFLQGEDGWLRYFVPGEDGMSLDWVHVIMGMEEYEYFFKYVLD